MAKNVSNLFKDVIRNGGPFYCYASVVLADGTEITLDSKNDFCIDGNGYDESSGSGFPLGVALSKSINIGILNTDDRFSEYDFYMAKITLYTEADLSDGTKERIKEGTFTVTDPTSIGELIDIVAYDDMYKANKEYTPAIQFPASALYVLQDVCGRCDINLGSATFTNSDFQIESVPEGLTCRQVIGFIAMIALGNAVCDANNHLAIKTYDFSIFETSDIITVGDMEDVDGLHILSEFSSDPDICTDDVVITGIRMDVEDEEGNINYILYGTRDYALNIDNDLVVGKEQEFVKMVGDKLIGVIIRPFNGSFFPDPTIEFMDPVCIIDRKYNIYQSFICNHSFEYVGNSTFSNEMESPSRNDSSYQSNATEAYRKAREEVKNQRSEWEKALEDLMDRVNDSSGLYTTEEEQPDGSIIYYMHDNPTLEESMIIWKMTAEAFAVSNDGGKTYSAGLTVDGNLIAKIMNTIGINFDWGIGGTLIIRNERGEEVVYMDAETGTVRMKVDSLSIAGKTPEEIAADNLNDFIDAVYDPAIANIQAQIDGQIETYYYDYEPTLSNAPASDWTTEEERTKHEGDLFYWKSKGYAYRFFKDGYTWKWQMVQDTDITKALAQAAEAQDTADQKRRVFVTTPVPPYDIGDLWVQGGSGDIMRCRTARQSGSYNSSDWVKASKYTDDSALEDFISGEFEDLKNQADKKAETWYQSTDPSISWSSSEKSEHKGDVWYNTSDEKTYIYSGTTWRETKTSPPDEVFDKIDGKAQIFISQPTPPYSSGDLWFNSSTSDIMTCINSRSTGSFNSSDWQKRNKYTDDSALEDFINGEFADTIDDISSQMDGKAETWYQSTDPSTAWTSTSIRNEHIGDIWYNTSSSVQKSYRWNGSSWQELKTTPPDDVFDQIDGKAQIFINTPTVPYHQGDLWFNSATSDIMTCIRTRTSGSYSSSDWKKRNKYTDDSATEDLDESLDQEGIFNRLTNNGQEQGIYIQNGKLYLNGEYLKSKSVTSKQIKIEGCESTGESGRKVIIENANYTIVENETSKAFFGFKSMGNSEDAYVIPRLVMGAYGHSLSDNYFGIVPYRGYGDNPQGSDDAYVDIFYHNIPHDDSSNIKMYSSGDIKLAPLRNLEITTNYADASYEGAVENRLAFFSTSSTSEFNSNLQIGAVVNHSNPNGLVLSDRYRDMPWGSTSGNSARRTSIRIQTDAAGSKFVRPIDGKGEIYIGSASFPFRSVITQSGSYSSNGVYVSEAQSLALDEIATENVLDNIFVYPPAQMYSSEDNVGDGEALILDVTNIKDTHYVEISDEGVPYMRTDELLKLLIMEVKTLKEEISQLKQSNLENQ